MLPIFRLFSASFRWELWYTVTDPKYGSCWIAMADLTRFFKRSSPHPLMKAQGITSVSISFCSSWRCPFPSLVNFISVPAQYVSVYVCVSVVLILSVSLCRWGSDIHQTIPSDHHVWAEAEGPWCCRDHRWQKISWQPHSRSQWSQGFRCAGTIICRMKLRLTECNCLHLLDHCSWLQLGNLVSIFQSQKCM